MPLAPRSVEDILKGGKRALPAKASSEPASKAAKPIVGASKANGLSTPSSADSKTTPRASSAQPTGGASDSSRSGSGGATPKPKVVTLSGGLQYEDVRPGSGPTASAGRKVNVKYAGTLTNGKQFDAGTIQFRLGAGEVIRGWDLGVAGMKVGGKRKLRIPPQLAYGQRGAPPTIPKNATLLFDVELKGC